jgi:ABC-type uncharacterized transport system substrate-binding protein
MERRSFLGTLVGALVTAPVVASAQPAGKVYRIGHLAASSPSAENTRLLGAFQAELRERGWVEGQNVAFEYRWAEGRYERLPALAAELTDTKVDLIVAGGTPNAVAAREVTRVIPIVMVGATTPVELGLVNSLARPGGNVTGVTFDVSPEQAAKQLELLTEVPGVSRIAVLLSRGYPAADRYRRAIEQAARARQRSIRFVEVLKPEDFDAAFATLRRTPVDGLIVMTDSGHPDPRRRHRPLRDRDEARDRVRGGPRGASSRRAGSSPGRRTRSRTGARPRRTSTRSSGARPRPPCRSSSRPRSSWWSTSGPPRRSASPCRPRCCCGRTR